MVQPPPQTVIALQLVGSKAKTEYVRWGRPDASHWAKPE